MTKVEIESSLEDTEDEIMLADGFEDAYLGIGRQFTRVPFAVYDRNKCIDILLKRDGMTEEEAEEYFQFNVEGAWVGDNTPVFIEPLKITKELESYEL
jgi:hypothetical protein